MVYTSRHKDSKQDTGWGLIFRLNLLQSKIEQDVEAADLRKWNLHLDRIFVNITFKKPEEIIKDDKGKIIDINFSLDDMEVFSVFNKQIEDLRNAMNKAKTNEDRKSMLEITNSLYSVLFKKDMWLRKKMFELKLYLRETDSDPRKAIYGN